MFTRSVLASYKTGRYGVSRSYRFSFGREYTTATTSVEERVQQFALKSFEEQRTIVAYFLLKRLNNPIREHDESAIITQMRRELTKQRELGIKISNRLLENKVWNDSSWLQAINALLTELGNKNIEWIDTERLKLLKVKESTAGAEKTRSFWKSFLIPIDASRVEKDKEEGLRVIVEDIKSWKIKYPKRTIVAIQEGVWNGRFLIDLYAQASKANLSMRIIGTDINPSAVAMFTILGRDVAQIPEKDFYVFFNDVETPITKTSLTGAGIKIQQSKMLNIYFRVLLDVSEYQMFQIIEVKAKEMRNGDIFNVTLIEETEECRRAFEEAGLQKKAEEGKLFKRYSRYIPGMGSSQVLIMKKGCMAGFLELLNKEYQLYLTNDGEVNINIDLARIENPTSFKAHHMVFKKRAA